MKTLMTLDEAYITALLKENVTAGEIESALEKAARLEGLSHRDTAALLAATDTETIDRIFRIAGQIKDHIYGERMVLFAPLYVSDYCVNRCAYCGFNKDNSRRRYKLTQDEVRAEVAILEKMGHKRLAIEAGEDPANCPLDYVLECIDTIYNMKFENGEIRRVNVNIAALDTEDYKHLSAAQIGTYILFQETYHRESYAHYHLSGPKRDYDYHITAFDRAMEAGIDDVGAGVLFGLYDYKYEVLALMLHNEHLESRFGVGFHTISVPRIRDTGHGCTYPYAVNDEDFLKLVAILRIAVPFTGMIVSTREHPDMRRKLTRVGISQMSAGSSTSVGGYSQSESVAAGKQSGGSEPGIRSKPTEGQFSLADHRDANEIFYWLMEEGILPSFCTACYRQGRSGDRFMELAKSGDIKNICLPNGLLTLKEYALDYGDERFKALAGMLIEEKLSGMKNEKVYGLVKEKLAQLEQGKRDLFI